MEKSSDYRRLKRQSADNVESAEKRSKAVVDVVVVVAVVVEWVLKS